MDHEKRVSGQSQQGVGPSQGPASPSAPGWSVPKERPSTVPPRTATTSPRSTQQAQQATSKMRTACTARLSSPAKSPRTLMGPGASFFPQRNRKGDAARAQ